MKNRGFAQFGIDPKNLPLISITFENSHCRLSIVWSILNFIIDFIDRVGYEPQNFFHSILIIQIGEHCMK